MSEKKLSDDGLKDLISKVKKKRKEFWEKFEHEKMMADLRKQYGFDVVQNIENSLVQQLSDDTNEEIINNIFKLDEENDDEIDDEI